MAAEKEEVVNMSRPAVGPGAVPQSGNGGQEPESLVEQAREKALQVGSQFRSKAEQRAKSIVKDQKDWAVDELKGVAQAFRNTSDKLRAQQQDDIAQYTDRLASRVERLSNYLGEKDIAEFMDGARDLVRRRPGLLLGGAFALGFVMARFLKSAGGEYAPSEPERPARKMPMASEGGEYGWH